MFMLDPIPALQTSLFHTAKVFKTLYRQAFPYKPKVLQRICRFLKKLVLLCNLSQRFHEIKTIFLDFEKVFTVRESTDPFLYVLKKCIHWFPEIFGTPNKDAGRDFIVELSSDYNVASGWPFSLFSNVGERSFASSAYFTLRLCHHFFDNKIKLANEERSAVSYERSVFLVDSLFREPKPRCVLNSIFVSMGNEYLEEGFTVQSVEPETNKSDHADERYKKEMKPWTVSNRNKSTRMVYERLKPSKSSNVSMPSTKSVRLKTWIFALAFLLSQAYAKPINKSNDTDKSIVYNFTALVTPRCNPENLDMTQHCQLNDFYLGLFIENCEFKNLCSPGYEPKCVDVQDGMVHICIPIGLTCEKGYRWHPWVDKTDQGVKVRVEKCPHDTFQQYKSNCFHACTTKHLDINDMPEHYLVYSEGNNIFPTYVYCNYEMGYYNRDYKFLMDYDQDSMHDPYFCQNVETFNPCIDNKIPLPNGSCVVPCMQGECRDDHDGFICKRHCREQTTDGETDGKLATRDEDEDECQGESGTCKNGVCPKSYKNNVCQCFPGYRNDIETRHCIDIDECQDIKGLCIYGNCTNTAGSYDCICGSGYKLEIGTRQCTKMNVTEDRSTDWIIFGSIIATIIAVCVIIFLCIHYKYRARCARNAPQEDDNSHSFSSSSAKTSSELVDEDLAGNKEEKQNCQAIHFHQAVENVKIETRYYTSVEGQTVKRLAEADSECCSKSSNEHSTDITVKDNSTKNLESSFAPAATRADKKFLKGSDEGEKYLGGTDVDVTIPLLPKKVETSNCSSVSKDNASPGFLMKEKETDTLLYKRTNGETIGETSSSSLFKGEEFKKDIDDTTTQATVSCLNDCMMSCGALVYKNNIAGSVFRVGANFVMTAFHVIKDIVKDLTGKCDYDFSCLEKSKDIILNFNESICYQPRRKINLKCRFYDEAVDVAILEMMNITGLEEDVPKGHFLWQYDIALLGVTKISTIGYGHVHNQLEKHLETCEILRDLEERLREALVSLHQKGQEYKDNLVTNRHDPLSVDIGYTGLDNQSFIVFDCYMGKGLSGAPILTNEGNSAKVIGIVLGGLPDFYYKLSPEKQASFQKRFLFEVGRKMKTIYEIIFSKDQNLAKQLFNGK